MDRIPARAELPTAPCPWVRAGDLHPRKQKADPPLRALAVGCIAAAVILFAVVI